MTESGKTTLARQIARQYRQRDYEILVLDPIGDPKWPCKKVYSDPQEYLDVVMRSKRCGLFIDDSGEMIGKYSGVMGALATRSRHLGHNAHFIVQRTAQLDKTVRDQCSYIYLFRVSFKDGQTLSDDYAQEELKNANKLDKGEFIMLKRFKDPKYLKIKWK
jgi:hypothetical protein